MDPTHNVCRNTIRVEAQYVPENNHTCVEARTVAACHAPQQQQPDPKNTRMPDHSDHMGRLNPGLRESTHNVCRNTIRLEAQYVSNKVVQQYLCGSKDRRRLPCAATAAGCPSIQNPSIDEAAAPLLPLPASAAASLLLPLAPPPLLLLNPRCCCSCNPTIPPPIFPLAAAAALPARRPYSGGIAGVGSRGAGDSSTVNPGSPRSFGDSDCTNPAPIMPAAPVIPVPAS
jgi:hypothetical protein